MATITTPETYQVRMVDAEGDTVLVSCETLAEAESLLALCNLHNVLAQIEGAAA